MAMKKIETTWAALVKRFRLRGINLSFQVLGLQYEPGWFVVATIPGDHDNVTLELEKPG